MIMEKMVLSEDGSYVAFLDVSGELFVKRMWKSPQNRHEWELDQEFHSPVPSHGGPIKNHLFHLESRLILVIRSHFLNIANISDGRLVLSVPFEAAVTTEWMRHPALPNYVLGFSTTNIQVFTWQDLDRAAAYIYCLPPQAPDSGVKLPNTTRYAIGRPISSSKSPYVLLKVAAQSGLEQIENQYVLFQVSDIHPRPETEESALSDGKDIPCDTFHRKSHQELENPWPFSLAGD